MRFVICLALISVCGCLMPGCSVGARTSIAGADALEPIANQLDVTLIEFAADLERADDSTRERVTAAFVARVKADAADEAALTAHIAAFTAALEHVEADKAVARDRLASGRDNVGLIREVAQGMRTVAIRAMRLDAEAEEYVESAVKKYHAAQAEREAEKATKKAERDAQIQQFINTAGLRLH
ncbi:MAG: hypothetical protein ACKV2Q_36630 [Planctomycetaceae bacterium]